MCGNFTANTARLDKWKRGIEDITYILNNDLCKLILTCREQVFRDEGFKHSDMEIFQTCKCNFRDDELALTYSDKENIAKRKELNNLFLDCKEGKYKISALLFLIICNNRVKKTYLPGKYKRVNKILEDIRSECGISEELTDGHSKRMNNSFHNALSTFIYQLPKDTISGLIQNTSSDFVCVMFVMNSNEMVSSFYTKHYGIILKHDHIQEYIERILGDMTKSDNVVGYMEHCRCCRNEEFRSELHSYLSKLSSITVTDLILNASESFVKNMFVMKVEDIHQSSDSIYERYGIEISTEHIQVFSERFLNVMTCYHYGSEYIRSWRCSKNNDFNLAIQKYMGQLSPKRIRELIENASQSFIQTMFVITVEDISQISFHVYRRYGIEIPGDIIQDYIERMFNDLKVLTPI
ncbi:unnamed protein product [Mytilus edulis]|uniref:Uncharacterized protein n=1 Tax=Mytilus edulis TaxID=6550 RepID=A0A8S3SSV1_MYTED|nr:unnamed protein product [Mytilus edulis]